MSRHVSYWIDDCLSCPFHRDLQDDTEDSLNDSFCEDLKTPFEYEGGLSEKWFPDWCPLESDNG